MTKKLSILFAILVLILASLACQTLSGGGGGDVPELPAPGNDGWSETDPQESGGENKSGASAFESEFPIPNGAINVQDLGGSTNFQAKMTLEEAITFYQEEFTEKGYAERPILHVTSETTINMVFDGHESGKAIIVQGVDMGDGTVNINIRLEDI